MYIQTDDDGGVSCLLPCASLPHLPWPKRRAGEVAARQIESRRSICLGLCLGRTVGSGICYESNVVLVPGLHGNSC